MAKISELGPITGANTRTEDLFVIVNLVQGDDGTKNITRKELVEAIQYEIFSRITITGGSISGVIMFNSTLRDVLIDDSNMEDSFIIRTDFDNGSLRNSTGDNLDITNSTFDDGDITDSTANNITITSSTFTNGGIFDSTGNNMVITNSQFNDGTGNNVILTNSVIDESLLQNSNANNVNITSSSFSDGTLTNSSANNLTISASDFIDGRINDSEINRSDITDSLFTDGNINNSNATNISITDSTFRDGEIFSSNADNIVITNSDFANGQIDDSLADNLIAENSQLLNSKVNNSIIEYSVFDFGDIRDSNANNILITNSDFSDGTGNNNVFTNTVIDQSTITNSTIANTDFTGTMDGVVAQNMTITSSSASGFDQTQSTFDSGAVTQSTFSGGQVLDSELSNFEMDLEEIFDPNIDEESWFALKNAKTGETERITYKQFFDEISKTVTGALKVHVDASKGKDEYPGSMLQPVRTLERACELALEKAGGVFDRNDVNNAVHISVGPGTYYTKGNLAIPDDCSATSTSGQYATVIEALPGYENNNCWLVGSGCYLQGFSYTNWKVDNFDYPEGGFAVAYRPGAKLRRSPYLRDSSQLSNFLRADVEPPLNPFNSKGTVLDLGRQMILEPGFTGQFNNGDKITFSSGAVGYLAWDDSEDIALGLAGDLATQRKIFVRNLKNNEGFQIGDTVVTKSGGVGVIESIGIDDFPNREVGRGGGCLLADRRVLDPDSLYTYVLCFGFTPRTQNGIGYVARDGAGVNGIGSLSIFTRCAFYALNGGQVTLNNSGSQFGDISMRARGSTRVFQPKGMNEALLLQNEAFADTLALNANNIIDDVVDHLTANTADGGLGYVGYDSGKCERDSGIILDGVALDVALNSNYWGRLAGITYRSPISYVVINDQLEPTIGANQYLQGRIEELFASANSEIIDRANTSFQELYNIIEYGEEYDNGLILTPTGNTQMEAAGELILDNKSFIQDELIDWIDNNDNFFSYDSKKCRRDTEEYIIPAVYYDTLLETNYNSITAGGAYYMSTAAKVIDKQKEETISAYRRLKDQINETVEDISPAASIRTDEAMDYIIDILNSAGNKFTPTDATYDPTSGIMVLTIGLHSLKEGQKVLIAPNSIRFSCASDNNVILISHPRVTDPIYNKPVYIEAVTSTTITLNVGDAGGYTGTHTFVDALDNSISVVGAEITFSDNAGIDVSRRNARKQLQANRGYIEDHLVGWINNNFYVYDQDKCKRDTGEYILPAVQRDLLLGTNYNSVNAGIAYYTATASKVIEEQKIETASAFNYLKGQVATIVAADAPSVTRTDAAFDEIIDILNNGTASADTITWSDPGASVLTANGTSAREQLQANRRFLQEEVIAYLDANYFTFDGDKCSRDTGLIIDAVRRDVITGSNYNAIFAGLAYRAGTASGNIVINEQLAETVAAIGYVKGEIGAELTGTALTRSDAAFDEIIDILNNGTGNADPINFGTHTVGPNENTARVALQLNKAFLQAEMTAWIAENYPTHQYDSASCERDLGYIIDSVSFDIQHGGNTASINNAVLYFNEAVAILPENQREITAAAFEHIASVADIVLRDQSVVVTTGNAASQDLTQTDVGVTVAGRVRTLINIVSDAIRSERFEFPNPVEPSIETGFEDASRDINGPKARLQDDVIDYLQLYQNGLPYKEAKCKRDVGLILDAVSKDIEYGGNASSIEAALYYFEARSAFDIADGTPSNQLFNILPPEQREPTQQAFTHLASVADQIVREATVTPTAGNDVTQDTSGTAANVATGTAVSDLILIIANNIGIGSPDNLPTLVTPSYDPNRKAARELIQANKGLLQEEVIQYLDDNYFVYDDVKCRRDTGLLIDAVKRDMLTGSNFNSVFNGLAYRSGTLGSDAVINEQLSETVSALEYVRDQSVAKVVTQNAKDRVTAGFNEIIDIMSNGEANADTINYGTQSFSADRLIGRQNLQNNKLFLQKEMTAYLNDNYFTYDDVKCRRDAGLIVDAAQLDVITGSNFGAIQAGLAYANAVYPLVDEKVQTIASFAALRDRIAEDVNPATLTRTNAAINEIIDIIDNGSGNADPLVFTDPGLVTERLYAREQLQANRAFIIEEIQAWIAENLPDYDVAKCQRDVEYIIDAVRRDLILGTNHNTITAGDAYLRTGSAYVLSNQLAYTIAGIEYARDLVKGLANVTQDALVDTLFQRVIDVLEGTVTTYTLPSYPTTSGSTYQDGDKVAATTAMRTNRAAIVDTIISAIGQFYPELEYDVNDCIRDTGYIVDALSHDVKYGGNSATVRAADAYYVGSVSQLGAEEIFPTIFAYQKLKETVNQYVVTVTEQDRVIELLDIIIDVIDNGTGSLPAVVEPDLSGLTTTEHNDIQTNQATIATNTTTYINNNFPQYDVAKCERDTGFIIDAVSHDVQYGGNRGIRAVALMYFNNEETNTLPVLQRQETNRAYQRLASVMSDIVTETLITPSTGVVLTQDTSGTPATATEAATVLALGAIIADVIDDETPVNIPAAVQPDQSFASVDIQAGADLLVANRSTYQDYVVNEFLAINYTNEECTRDLGYIVDAVRRDLILTTDHNTVTAANAYLRDSYTGARGEAEVDVINNARDAIKALPLVTSDATIDTLFKRVTDMIDGTTTALLSSTFPNTPGSAYQTADRVQAATDIQTNRATIISELTTWIQANRPEIYYDNAKCERDIGYIIDAVRRDLLTGSNHNTITAGNAYLRPTSNYPANDQVAATVAAVNYARDLVTKLPNVESVGEISNLFRTVTKFIDGTETTIQPSFFPPTPGATFQIADRQQAVAELQGAKQTIVDELIQYIAVTYPSLTYDQAKCERDTGFIIDGLCHDVLYGGTAATTINAESYFEGAVLQLGGASEQSATADAYNQLKTIIATYTTGLVGAIINEIQTLLDIVIDVITAGSLSGLPAVVEIDTTGLDTTEFDDITSGQAAIITDVVSWVNTNFPTYDVADCERDTGFVLDSLTHDIKYGGNSSSRLSAIAYLDGNVNTNIGDAEELAAGIAAYTELKTILNTYITTTAEQTVKDTLLDIIIDVLTAGNLTGLPAVVEPDLTGLTATEHDEISTNQATVIANSVQYANDTYPRSLGYNEAKCERDLGYLIDAVSWDLQHESNTASINDATLYFENATSVLPSYQRPATAEAFNHIAAVAKLIIQNDAVTPTTGNAETQILGGAATTATGDVGKGLIEIVSGVIAANSLSGLPTASEPDQAAYDQEYIDAVAAIDGAKTSIQAQVINYINTEFNGLGYDQAKCERDTGYIIDSISHDIQYSGNSATVQNSQIYFENAVNVLPTTQREPTKKAFTHLGEMIEKVVQRQDIGFRVISEINVLTASYSPTTGIMIITTHDPHRMSTGDHIVFQQEGITFECGDPAVQISHPRVTDPTFKTPVQVLSTTTNTFTVNVGDAGTYEAAHTFVSAIPNAILQVENTIAQDTSLVAGNPAIALEAKNLATMIANVVDDTTSANLPERIDPDTSWVASTFIDSKELIEDSKTTLQNGIVQFIAENLNGLGYDELKCRRDIQFIINGLSHDVQYGGNHATRINAQIYFENAVSTLATGTERQTADAYEYLALLVRDIVQGIDTQSSLYTSTPQDFTQDNATSTEGARAQNLIEVIESAIREGTTDTIPELVEPDFSWVNSDIESAGNLMLTRTPELSQDLIDWISSQFTVLDYDRAKCRRDTGYILEAFAYDLHYGGNTASRWNADFYFWNGLLRVPEDQREPTGQAYRQLGLICEQIVKGTYPGQVAKGSIATDVEGTKVRRFGQDLYEVLYFNDVKKLPLRIEPNFEELGINKDFIDFKDSIKFLRSELAFDTVRFVSATYGFIDIPLTRRDTFNLLSAIQNDFKFFNSSTGDFGSQNAVRTYVSSFFDYNADIVFPVFNPSISGLEYKGSVSIIADLNGITGQKLNDAYIVATDINVSNFAGNIYYWNGVAWQFDGPNNTELLDAFIGSFERIRDFIITNYSPNSDVTAMLQGLINLCLIDNLLRPNTLVFGSLVESIAHQFNGASAGVNRNALPLNFRNLGSAISALASVLYEEGGRIRWSGSDELNNQYFARGLRINGRTGRIEGRPFTSSVRKLARRASQSRAFV